MCQVVSIKQAQVSKSQGILIRHLQADISTVLASQIRYCHKFFVEQQVLSGQFEYFACFELLRFDAMLYIWNLSQFRNFFSYPAGDPVCVLHHHLLGKISRD